MGQLQITSEGYEEIKQIIRDKLNETADNFIVIGYYLKQVRDNLLYKMDGYRSMEEFAKGQYGISQSTASRFMDINTKFSKDGNSTEISEQYRGYGASKLQEMLTMREEDMGLVTPEMTVRQIKEIKEAERAERQQEEQEAAQHLPIVEMARAADETDTAEETAHATSHEVMDELPPVMQTLAALWKAKPAELRTAVCSNMVTDRELAEQLSPSGSRTFTYGTYMMFLYTHAVGVKFRYYADGTAHVEAYTYADLITMTQELESNGVFDEGRKQEPFMNEPVGEPEKEPEEESVEESEEEQAGETKKEPWTAPEPVENPAGQQEGFVPLPGQTVLNGQGEVTESGAPDTQSGGNGIPSGTAEDAPRQQGYAPIDISNAKGYFEMEIERMTNMGGTTRESTRCRNYKIALEAIRGYFGV